MLWWSYMESNAEFPLAQESGPADNFLNKETGQMRGETSLGYGLISISQAIEGAPTPQEKLKQAILGGLGLAILAASGGS